MNIYALEQLIKSAMHTAQVPGVALAIVHQGAVIYANGFGVTSIEEGGIPVTPHTLFRIGSITKSMTTTLIMHLVEQGQLDLDVPIKTYLPDFEFSEPAHVDQITLRLLLSHQAGLMSSYSTVGRRDPDALKHHVYSEIAHQPFIAPPNTVYSYANPGFRLAGYIAEVISGQNYTDLMQQLVFDRIGMTHTTFDPTVAMTYPLAQSHDLKLGGSLSVQHQYADNAGTYPSGGVISNVLDLAKYTIFHMRHFPEMQHPHANRYALNDGHYGLGWSLETVKGVKRVGHEGLISTFGSKLIMADQTAVIILNNRAFSFWETMDTVINQVFGELIPPQVVEIIPPTIDKTHWQAYVGNYLGWERGVATISIEDDHLVMVWNGESIPLQPLRDDLFYGEKSGKFAVGFMPPYLMINSSPCEPIDHIEAVSVPQDILEGFIGTYRGADKIILHMQDNKLYASSEEYNLDVPCYPLSETRFACDFGILEFQAGQLVVSRVYPHRKVG